MTCQELFDRDFCPHESDYPVIEEDLIRHYEETRRQQAETSNGHRRLAVAFVVSAVATYWPGTQG